MIETLPKPNTQALSWFYGENKKGTLRLNPKYQRNPIWSIGQKCFLIDSLISGNPIPQVYINVKTRGSGSSRQTIYEVVDGQQRLRAILEFMDDKYKLVATAAKAYPVSSTYKPYIGKIYSELPQRLQETIWNYPLAVQELRGWRDKQIRALFRRLNYVVEKLNKQELRHSQYFGEFVTAVEALAEDVFWDDLAFFSRREAARMKDVEFVSELFVLTIDGVQDGQKSLDRFFAKYDVDFPRRNSYVQKFHQVLSSLRTISDMITSTRFSKKADLYGLFAAALEINRSTSSPVDLTPAKGALQRLSRELEKAPEVLTDIPARYYSTVIEGPNKLAKRQLRKSILLQIIRDALPAQT